MPSCFKNSSPTLLTVKEKKNMVAVAIAAATILLGSFLSEKLNGIFFIKMFINLNSCDRKANFDRMKGVEKRQAQYLAFLMLIAMPMLSLHLL
jgi:hypothetical protein